MLISNNQHLLRVLLIKITKDMVLNHIFYLFLKTTVHIDKSNKKRGILYGKKTTEI